MAATDPLIFHPRMELRTTMKKPLLTAIALLAAWLLSGCQPERPAAERVDLWLQPTLTQADALALGIARIEIWPYVRTSEGTYSPMSREMGLPVEDEAQDPYHVAIASVSLSFDRPIVLRDLPAPQAYRIYVQAYDKANKVISRDGAAAFVDVEVGLTEHPIIEAKLPVPLIEGYLEARQATTSSLFTKDGTRSTRIGVLRPIQR